jgi:hypothetical protein
MQAVFDSISYTVRIAFYTSKIKYSPIETNLNMLIS